MARDRKVHVSCRGKASDPATPFSTCQVVLVQAGGQQPSGADTSKRNQVLSGLTGGQPCTSWFAVCHWPPSGLILARK